MSDNVVEMRCKKTGPSLSPVELIGLIWNESIERRAQALGIQPQYFRSTVTTALALIQEAHASTVELANASERDRRAPALALRDQAYLAQLAATAPVIADLMLELQRLTTLPPAAPS